MDDGQGPQDQRPQKPPSKLPPPRLRMSRGVMSWLGFVLIALLIAMVVSQQYPSPLVISIDDFWKQAANNNFSEIVVSDDQIHGTFKEGTQGLPRGMGQNLRFKVNYRLEDQLPEMEAKLRKTCPQTKITYEPSNPPYMQILVSVVPWILIIAFSWFFIFRQLRSSAGGAGMLGNFGRSRHRVSNKELTNITFKDVAGVDEAK